MGSLLRCAVLVARSVRGGLSLDDFAPAVELRAPSLEVRGYVNLATGYSSELRALVLGARAAGVEVSTVALDERRPLRFAGPAAELPSEHLAALRGLDDDPRGLCVLHLSSSSDFFTAADDFVRYHIYRVVVEVESLDA